MTLLPTYRRQPITIRRGWGAWVEDERGRRYVDFVAGVGVHALGHGHPKIVEAISRQAAQLVHCSNLYHCEAQASFAHRLCKLARMDGVFLCNSGTEAVEAAIKLARKHWHRAGEPSRTRIVYASGSFHGRTLGALALTDNAAYRIGFEPLPASMERIGFNASEDVERIDAATAAVIVEPVQGESGVREASAAWLARLRERCDATGALLVFDEIQCGLGRTGWVFAHERSAVRPDVLLLAKALGGGLPLGAVAVRSPLVGALQPGDHGSTFGGNPVACAAGSVVLAALEEPAFLEQVRSRERTLRAWLEAAAVRHAGVVKEIRCFGLMAAIELRDRLAASDVVSEALARGVLVTTAGGNAVRLLPPLAIDEPTLDEGLRRLAAGITQACRARDDDPSRSRARR